MKQGKRRQQKLATKFIISFVILGIIVAVSSCIVGYVKYTQILEKMYNDTAYEIADLVKEEFNGDDIEDYLDRVREADDDELSEVAKSITDENKYQIILERISNIRDNMGANYIYIADQRDDSGKVSTTLTYLFDADNPNDEYEPFMPGDTSDMNPDFISDSEYIYETGKRSDNYFYSHSDFGYNTSAISAIKNSDGEVIAIVGVELAMKTLQKARKDYVIMILVLGLIITALLMFGYWIYVRKRIVKPIEIVTNESSKFVKDDTEISEKLNEIKTNDEIEQMAKTIYQMQVDTRKYIDDLTKVTADRERIGAELNIAKEIQANMLPGIFPAFPERSEFDIYASMNPAKEVGGDFYDFYMVDDDHLAMVMADVSGKGVPAALFMVISKTIIKNFALNGLSAKEVLDKTNERLCENNKADMFVTVWIGILEISTGKLDCANAGHEYPVICRKGKSYELIKDKHGFVLGGMPMAKQHSYEIQLEVGDKLFLYTDGVPEATNSNNELYGNDRMLQSLNSNIEAKTYETLGIVKDGIDAFVGDAMQFDDITMLSFEYFGKGSDKSVEGNSINDGTVISDEITVEAKIDNIEKVTDFAEALMERKSIPMNVSMHVSVAIDEIFSNIAQYAYGENVGNATVKVKISEDNIKLQFIDNGMEYNPLKAEDPDITLSAEEREIGGLGVFMVKKTMDEVSYCYENGNNILTIKKSF